jgi:hypothetical protein
MTIRRRSGMVGTKMEFNSMSEASKSIVFKRLKSLDDTGRMLLKRGDDQHIGQGKTESSCYPVNKRLKQELGWE